MRNKFAHYARLAGLVLALTLGFSLVVLAIALASGWNTPTQFSNGFFFGGMILIAIGGFSVVGGFAQRTDFKMTDSPSAGDTSLAERTRHMMADVQQGYGFLLLTVGSGILLITISILIAQFTGNN